MEDVKKMTIFVEDYIYKRKNIIIRINVRPMDMYSLVIAYNYAKDWLINNNI